MNKFFNVLLKIILMLSFVGIIFTVGMAIINNQSISFEAYNYICSTRDTTNFVSFNTKMNSVWENKGDENKDPYVVTVSKAVNELNKGISYYLDYLAIEPNLTKGEQDKLASKYKTYIENVNQTLDSYEKYLSIYTGTTVDKVPIFAKKVLESLINTYRKGSLFFVDLVNVVNNNSLNNSGNFLYTGQTYMLKVGFANYMIMDKFYDLGKYSDKRASNELLSETFEEFNNYCARCSKPLNETIIDNDLRIYIETLNELNIYEFAGNYTNYIKTLSGEKKEKAIRARSYFEAMLTI